MSKNSEDWYWYSSHGGMMLEQLGMPDNPPTKCRDCEHSCKVIIDKVEHFVCAIERDEGDMRVELHEVDPDELCEIEF